MAKSLKERKAAFKADVYKESFDPQGRRDWCIWLVDLHKLVDKHFSESEGDDGL